MSCAGNAAVMAGLVLLLSACGGIRNVEKHGEHTKSSSDSSLSVLQVQVQQKAKALEQLTVKTDSTKRSYIIQIWPKGKFSYSAEHGFEGMADKILISGKFKQAQQLLSTNSLKESQSQFAEQRFELEKHSDLEKKKTAINKAVSWKTVLGYALIAFCLIALVRVLLVN